MLSNNKRPRSAILYKILHLQLFLAYFRKKYIHLVSYYNSNLLYL